MTKAVGRKLYTIPEFYQVLYRGIRTFPSLERAKKRGLLKTQAVERIMLAVTEVNQCPLCAYGHTRMALESGLTQEDIRALLSHSMDGVPEEEIPAILFAQYYADSRSRPSPEAWRRVVDHYGIEKATGILGAVRMITIGNAVGIVLSSIGGRFHSEQDKRSSPLYEAAILLLLAPFTMIAALHALITGLLRLPVQ